MRPVLVRQAVIQRTDAENRDSLVAELRAELARKIAFYTRGVGEQITAVPGLHAVSADGDDCLLSRDVRAQL